MNKRTDYSRSRKRTAPFGVRLDAKLFEKIKKEQDLKTMQQVVDFLAKFYEEKSLLASLSLNPVMERNTPVETAEGSNLGNRAQTGKVVASATPPDSTNGENFRQAWKSSKQEVYDAPRIGGDLSDEFDGKRTPEEHKKALRAEIARLEKEIANPPKFATTYGLKNYKLERQKVINLLKQDL